MGYSTQKEVRRAFWNEHQRLSSRRLKNGDYCADTRCAFVEYVDHLVRNGYITEALAQRVTL